MLRNILLSFSLLSFCFLLISCMSSSAPIDFSAIRSGTFFQYGKDAQLHSTIIRNDSLQIEINTRTGDTSVWKIEWLDSSAYYCKILSLPKSKSPNEFAKYNRSILLIQLRELTDSYFTYQGELTIDGETGVVSDTLWRVRK